MANTLLAAGSGDVVSSLFDPIQELFTGSVVPAVAIALVASVGLTIAARKVRQYVGK